MKVLFVSGGELIGAGLPCRLKKEGCDVRLYIEDESRKDCLDGIIRKTDDWEKELKWVGRSGLIVFDDVGYGKTQDELRAAGYLVVGGSEGGDRLEVDRQFAQQIFSECGMTMVPTFEFQNVIEAIKFVKKEKGSWVVKQKGHNCTVNYVGVIADGRDVISVLERYKTCEAQEYGNVSLQRKIEGIEIGVARYFNGFDWVGPVEINIEHKPLFNNDLGPMTGEMGTLMWYESNDNNRLFQATLAKMKDYLKKVNFKGDIDINCKVTGGHVYPLEATARVGCPATQLQSIIHLSPWTDFLTALARGEHYPLRYRKGYGVVVTIAIPPFPYRGISHDHFMKGGEILFRDLLSEEEMNCIHFEEVALKNVNGAKKYIIAGNLGYILYVTGFGNTVQEARERTYGLVAKIVIPKMFYRTDIGLKYLDGDRLLLKKWGYI